MNTRLNTLVSNAKGSTVIEASLVLPVLISLLFVGISLLLTIYRVNAIEHMLTRTARGAIVMSEDPALRVKNIETLVMNTAESYGIPLSAENIHVCPLDDAPCQQGEATESPGGPEDLMTITVDYTLPILNHYGLEYTSTVIARNEPF